MKNKYNKEIANSIKSLLSEIGENPEREGLLKTPERVAKSMDFLTNGYHQNPGKILNAAMFKPEATSTALGVNFSASLTT